MGFPAFVSGPNMSGMSLRQVAEFVREALDAGVDSDRPVQVQTSYGSDDEAIVRLVIRQED